MLLDSRVHQATDVKVGAFSYDAALVLTKIGANGIMLDNYIQAHPQYLYVAALVFLL